jgi:hypothetical protein
VLSLMVLFITVRVPPSLLMPPPLPQQLIPELLTVLSLSVSPPCFSVLELGEIHQRTTAKIISCSHFAACHAEATRRQCEAKRRSRALTALPTRLRPATARQAEQRLQFRSFKYRIDLSARCQGKCQR